jgi:hypothetical protein
MLLIGSREANLKMESSTWESGLVSKNLKIMGSFLLIKFIKFRTSLNSLTLRESLISRRTYLVWVKLSQEAPRTVALIRNNKSSVVI